MAEDLTKKYVRTKRNQCKSTGKEWNLTLSDVHWLLYMAGITIKDVGRSSGSSYQLARFNDEGPYAPGNCRFITLREHMREQKWTPERRARQAENIRKQKINKHRWTPEKREEQRQRMKENRIWENRL